jgi:hypothetical protein
MKNSTLLKAALLGGTAVTLAACGGSGGGGSASTTPVTVPSLESQFGAAFNTDYFAAANSEPVVPQPGDIIALTLTSEPVALH